MPGSETLREGPWSSISGRQRHRTRRLGAYGAHACHLLWCRHYQGFGKTPFLVCLMLQDGHEGPEWRVGPLALCPCSLESQSRPEGMGPLFTDSESAGAGHLPELLSQPATGGGLFCTCVPAHRLDSGDPGNREITLLCSILFCRAGPWFSFLAPGFC